MGNKFKNISNSNATVISDDIRIFKASVWFEQLTNSDAKGTKRSVLGDPKSPKLHTKVPRLDIRQDWYIHYHALYKNVEMKMFA